MDKTALIKTFIHNAGSSIISVNFIKQNGDRRSIQFNPLDAQEIKGTGYALKHSSIVRCRDFTIAKNNGAGAWRSFDCDRVVSIKAKGQVLEFQL